MHTLSFLLVCFFLFASTSHAQSVSRSVNVTLEGVIHPSCTIESHTTEIKGGYLEIQTTERCNTQRDLKLSTKKIPLQATILSEQIDGVGNSTLSSPINSKRQAYYTLEVCSK